MPRALRIALLLLFACFFSGCTMWPPKSTAWSNSTGLEQFEHLWWQSVQEKNWSELARHMAASYVANYNSAHHSREQTLNDLHQLQINDFSIGNIAIAPNGDTAVITYTLNLDGTFSGAPIRINDAQEMTVWQQQKHGWSAIAHSGEFFIANR